LGVLNTEQFASTLIGDNFVTIFVGGNRRESFDEYTPRTERVSAPGRD
jgi:hypothetical protein